jgi:hypothetical protein
MLRIHGKHCRDPVAYVDLLPCKQSSKCREFHHLKLFFFYAKYESNSSCVFMMMFSLLSVRLFERYLNIVDRNEINLMDEPIILSWFVFFFCIKS